MNYPKRVFGLAKFTGGQNVGTRSVHFEKERVAATDGHKLVIWTPPEGAWLDFEPFGIAEDDCKNVGKGLNAHDMATLNEKETEASNHVAFSVPNGTVTVPKQVKDFPRIDAVIPDKDKATMTIGLNAAYLQEICAALKSFALDPKNATLAFRFTDKKSSVRIDLETPDSNTGEVTAILMPVKLI